MKILSVSVKNFASYKSLDFDFTNQGLCLIQGPTGSGKSTLCDIIPWILFGQTSKGGKVDEIRSWNSQDTTYGSIRLSGNIIITRSRSPNDLFYTVSGSDSSVPSRGKDLGDTQKLIDNLLGMNYDLYLAGSYLHEFNQTSQFFTTTAKNRRMICEQLVDLSLAKKLQGKLSEEQKTKTKELASIKSSLDTIGSNINLLKRLETAEIVKAQSWEKEQLRLKEQYTTSADRFESNRKRVISNQCRSCGTVLAEAKEIIDSSENPYTSRLADLAQATNPHQGGVKDYSKEITLAQQDNALLEGQQNTLCIELSEIETLGLVVNDYRSLSIENTIKNIEKETNSLFTDYFDSEIQVSFDIAEADKLEVTIHKDGNLAAFTQLSKGQRCLLKLCFSVSVLKAVANQHGLNFNAIFFDEALDGLDERMKTKAYRLLETLSLEYESVFVVEHSETLKNLFENKYSVELINGSSEIGKT